MACRGHVFMSQSPLHQYPAVPRILEYVGCIDVAPVARGDEFLDQLVRSRTIIVFANQTLPVREPCPSVGSGSDENATGSALQTRRNPRGSECDSWCVATGRV